MLLDVGDFGHHMMDWDLNHWIPMFFGGIAVLLAIIVIFYIIIQNTRSNNEKNHNVMQAPKIKQNELHVYEKWKDDVDEINFCFNCGTKLVRKPLQYCPNCGTML